MSFEIKDAVDATEPYKFKLIAKACRNLRLRDPHNCYGARAIKFQDPKVQDVQVMLNVTYVRFKDQDLPVRYINSEEVRKIAEINDLQGKRGMLKALRLFQTFGQVEVTLLPPPPKRRLDYLRSAEFAAIRNGSQARRKGKPKRKYTKPQDIGLRNGMGKAHSWEEQS